LDHLGSLDDSISFILENSESTEKYYLNRIAEECTIERKKLDITELQHSEPTSGSEKFTMAKLLQFQNLALLFPHVEPDLLVFCFLSLRCILTHLALHISPM
jgi:hypothetical protein